jgi:hypothetical protein
MGGAAGVIGREDLPVCPFHPQRAVVALQLAVLPGAVRLQEVQVLTSPKDNRLVILGARVLGEFGDDPEQNNCRHELVVAGQSLAIRIEIWRSGFRTWCRLSNSLADSDSSACGFAEFSSRWRTGFSHFVANPRTARCVLRKRRAGKPHRYRNHLRRRSSALRGEAARPSGLSEPVAYQQVFVSWVAHKQGR